MTFGNKNDCFCWVLNLFCSLVLLFRMILEILIWLSIVYASILHPMTNKLNKHDVLSVLHVGGHLQCEKSACMGTILIIPLTDKYLCSKICLKKRAVEKSFQLLTMYSWLYVSQFMVWSEILFFPWQWPYFDVSSCVLHYRISLLTRTHSY